MEDVLTLGQGVEVRVDDIDPQGKVSLSLAAAPERALELRGGGGPARPTVTTGVTVGRVVHLVPGPVVGLVLGARHRRPPPVVFEDAFEAELVADLGDLGPGAADAGNDRGDRSDRRPAAATAVPRVGARRRR